MYSKIRYFTQYLNHFSARNLRRRMAREEKRKQIFYILFKDIYTEGNCDILNLLGPGNEACVDAVLQHLTCRGCHL